MGMGKTRVRTTSSIQKAWITNFEQKSARGDYEPFYRTQDITSSGIKGRIPCPINPGLVYHTLSLNETFTLIQLLHDPLVVDIKEQYPELDVKKSKAFAEALGIKHPRHVWSTTESVTRRVRVVVLSSFTRVRVRRRVVSRLKWLYPQKEKKQY